MIFITNLNLKLGRFSTQAYLSLILVADVVGAGRAGRLSGISLLSLVCATLSPLHI